VGIRFLTSNVSLFHRFRCACLGMWADFWFEALAAQALFQRSLLGLDIATGKVSVKGEYATNGTASATHTESFAPIPTGGSEQDRFYS